MTFHCLIRDYNTTQPEIIWTKDGSPILMSEDGDYFVVQDGGQVLTVVRPTSSEAGVYRCEAKNKAGIDSHQFKLTVTGNLEWIRRFSTRATQLVLLKWEILTRESPKISSILCVCAFYFVLTGLASALCLFRSQPSHRRA